MAAPPYDPPPAPGGYVAAAQSPRTGMAITALVFGILGLICSFGFIFGLIGVIVGLIALARISGNPQRFGGKGLAIGGVATGGISLVLGVVLIMAVVPFFGKVWGLAKTATNLEAIGMALQSYQSQYQEYPPDLDTLVDQGMLLNPLDPAAPATEATGGVYYVTGLSAGDPSHWIVAYAEVEIMGQKLVGLLQVNGQTDMVEQPRFAAQLAAFQAEYEAAHGEPPTILAPEDADDAAEDEWDSKTP